MDTKHGLLLRPWKKLLMYSTVQSAMQAKEYSLAT